MKVVLASSNPGKIRELTEMLKPFHIEVVPQAELGVSDADETGLTFIENAIIKARHAALATGLPAISDDSGIAVDALGGSPGIYSARYAGVKSSPEENIQKLLTVMKDIPDDQRQASFHCVLVFMLHDNDPTPIICDGKWSGMITHQPQGTEGHGYDPIFFVPEENKTAAELSSEKKNQLSHRGKALRLLINQLSEITC